MERFIKHIAVAEEDLDELQHVNNVRYVQWIQDIAKEHWEKAASEAIRKEVVWVLVKHTIHYKSEAKLGTPIVAKTYVQESKGATSTRIVELNNKATNKPIVHSITEWVLLNKKSFKPQRISPEIKTIFHPIATSS